jgi:hypothetical protein
MEFIEAGRLSVIVATAPVRSTRTGWSAAFAVSAMTAPH